MVPHTKYLDLAKIYYVDCPIGGTNTGSILVSYTHLDVYKRQAVGTMPCLSNVSIQSVPIVSLLPVKGS